MQDTKLTTCAEATVLDEESSARLFRHLIEHSGQGFLVAGADCRPIYANARLAEIFGYPSAAAIMAQPSCLALFIQEDGEELGKDLQRSFVGERDMRGVRPDGSVVWVENRIVRLPWRNDPAFCMIISDVSMQKRLEGVVADLDHQLAHLDRLRMVYEMGAEVVHEVSQPLSALQGYATAIEQAYARDTASAERVLGLVAKIRRCGDNVRDTVLRMRNFGRKDALPSAESQCVDAAVAVREAVEIAMRGIRSRNPNVRVAMSLPAGLPAIAVDPMELQQVIINLLQNAANALPADAPSGTRILVRAERQGGRLMLEIIDTGHGMSPDVLSHIFDPFFTTSAEGMGLGLPICRRIVEGWGGKLLASSGVGEGTTMRLDLPFAARPPAVGA